MISADKCVIDGVRHSLIFALSYLALYCMQVCIYMLFTRFNPLAARSISHWGLPGEQTEV